MQTKYKIKHNKNGRKSYNGHKHTQHLKNFWWRINW